MGCSDGRAAGWHGGRFEGHRLHGHDFLGENYPRGLRKWVRTSAAIFLFTFRSEAGRSEAGSSEFSAKAPPGLATSADKSMYAAGETG